MLLVSSLRDAARYWTTGEHRAYPQEVAPAGGFPVKGGMAGTVSMTATVVAQTFNTSITSGPGDFWISTLNNLTPGTFIIKPSGKAGTVVRGELYVDNWVEAGFVYSGSEITEIPYTDKIG